MHPSGALVSPKEGESPYLRHVPPTAIKRWASGFKIGIMLSSGSVLGLQVGGLVLLGVLPIIRAGSGPKL